MAAAAAVDPKANLSCGRGAGGDTAAAVAAVREQLAKICSSIAAVARKVPRKEWDKLIC